MPGEIVVADTSVLINFLRIDRMDLIGRYPGRFVATDHVAEEITLSYPAQQARYAAAVAARMLETISVTDPAETALFLKLRPGERLGAGECSAIAVALHRGHAIAMDDNRAINRALKEAGLSGARLSVLRTADVMVGLIRGGVLSVAEADAIKDDWATNHRFRLKPGSFGEVA